MMNVKSIFPSRWLSADDLGQRRVEVTIAGCSVEEVHNSRTNTKEQKLAIAFERASKRLLVNKTQAFQIAEIAGSYETDDWAGKRISMRAGRARNGKPTIVIEAAAVQPPTDHTETGEQAK